ncbi:RIBOSOMAL LARGE SUBUNIT PSEUDOURIDINE SYNTHASE D (PSEUDOURIDYLATE SYNTHASE) (URACIL HYDROLYASE) [Mycoplasmopsis pulmonis]|uniref:Pseudouridine synthase n=1 Tax=Mycoplasmopsis pulmonis (strain UAB CTIP) TaxID=272635 RepID=Q98QR3_MYCPU|nr:RluA family pseudouridine synthase [Mycoplasmopsis pulmonis]MDZ7293257.1 RluA family pseudouridine synthase [Mycoplasmopsis pulmonis]CAC13471.1 RIBOSOMAL LARGE SUBUNIT PSEUDOURIDINE SYNTHASE D (PSEUDOURIDYLATE SYNTHASE) (URACIL HYDROLYASE) [Mycoplasmopsis pulmonis]
MLKMTSKYSERIDKYISDNSAISRNDIKSLILEKAVFVNGKVIQKPNFILKPDAEIEVIKVIDKTIDLKPEKMDLDIVYEDEHLIVINKPSGLVVHPAPGHYSQTLVNGLIYHFKNLSNENGLLRPGIVHRIDKDTSGLLIIAKTNQVHQLLAKMLKNHEIKRSYIAIVEGFFENKIVHLNLPIGRSQKDRKKMEITNNNSKNAITHVYLIKQFYYEKQPLSLVECQLETGRTHQIRVHLNYFKHPVWNDPLYGKSFSDYGQYLHAYKLFFVHPITNQELTFEIPMPEEFQRIINN